LQFLFFFFFYFSLNRSFSDEIMAATEPCGGYRWFDPKLYIATERKDKKIKTRTETETEKETQSGKATLAENESDKEVQTEKETVFST